MHRHVLPHARKTALQGAADRVSDRVGKLVFLDAPAGRSQIEAFPALLKERENGQVIDGVELVLFPSEDLVRFLGLRMPRTSSGCCHASPLTRGKLLSSRSS